eukprot:gnl/TRDRNA2_/TRDRNA2_28213_c0_seq1.p1 gnl/TRDRNA2_/TRDRNA2_28213_c0~~gnl/TRDRNA2_/TRDRNA2_28213_c0_seq1.p1  ORF type:complete len:188 (+),score=38.02 gnl/TRDRNA2_/TRDRNA2_28213_c0_seq1:49-564(+)
MIPAAQRVFFCCLVIPAVVFSGQPPPGVKLEPWSDEVKALFVENSFKDKEAALKLSKEQNKPIMVMITKMDCPACNGIRTLVNGPEGVFVRNLFEKFVLVHLTEDEIELVKQYRQPGMSYTPQFYFFASDGKLLDVKPGVKDWKYYFFSIDEIRDGMRKALSMYKKYKPEL